MVNSRIRARLLEARVAARDCQIALAGELGVLGAWTLEPSTGDLLCSAQCRALMDVPCEPATSFDQFISQIHAEDQARVRRAFAQALQMRREFAVDFRSASGAMLRAAGRPHASAISREHPALSGVLQSIEPASGNADVAQKMSLMVRRLEQLREVERNSLASRMESEVSQRLNALHARLESLAVNGQLPAAARAELAALSAAAADCQESVRGAIFEMTPPGVAELGFAGAVERYASEQAAAAGIELALAVPATSLPLDTPALDALYVVARTGIDNVVRHAAARHMRVEVTCDAEEVVLRIQDDGIGIRDADLMKDSACGLFASSERLAGSGGELRVTGQPDEGTLLEATIVLRQQIRGLRHNVTPLRVA